MDRNFMMMATEKISFVFLQETQIQDITANNIREFWGDDNFKWMHYPANGRSGGILTIWDDENYEVMDDLQGPCSVSILIKNRGDGKIWSLSNIYGPTGRGNKEEMWDELWDIIGYWNFPLDSRW